MKEKIKRNLIIFARNLPSKRSHVSSSAALSHSIGFHCCSSPSPAGSWISGAGGSTGRLSPPGGGFHPPSSSPSSASSPTAKNTEVIKDLKCSFQNLILHFMHIRLTSILCKKYYDVFFFQSWELLSWILIIHNPDRMISISTVGTYNLQGVENKKRSSSIRMLEIQNQI